VTLSACGVSAWQSEGVFAVHPSTSVGAMRLDDRAVAVIAHAFDMRGVVLACCLKPDHHASFRSNAESKSERSGTGADIANLSKAVRHVESELRRFGNPRVSQTTRNLV
jgi:hypothetical protein